MHLFNVIITNRSLANINISPGPIARRQQHTGLIEFHEKFAARRKFNAVEIRLNLRAEVARASP